MLLWMANWYPPYLVLCSSLWILLQKMSKIFPRSSLNCFGCEFGEQGSVCISFVGVFIYFFKTSVSLFN